MTWVGHPARIAMDLQRAGWKVRTVAGRRIWYKGQAGAEIVAKNMVDAANMELTLRRTRAPSLFMYGPDVAELLGALPPSPPPPKPRRPKKLRELERLRQHVAEAESLIRDLESHEGAEGWSADLRARLDAFKPETTA